MEAIEAQGVRRAPEETPINSTGTNAEGDAPAETDLRIAVSVDQRERQVVASTIAGQVRELDLRVRYAWQAFDGKGQPLTPPIDMVLSQEMSYQESAVLTKEFEQESIYRSLQARMVGQIMRRLAVLPTRPAGATSESPPR
jgi:LPS-assembly lipoprotein